MADTEINAGESSTSSESSSSHEPIPTEPPLKRFKKIPIYVVEEHNDALQFIYSAIGGKKLPATGFTMVHLDSHPDMLIDRKLKGTEARSGKAVLPLLQIENWIVPAAAAGFFNRVIWVRPPWANQIQDSIRVVFVGDHPDTGYLRVDCYEPYYLSDALYSSKLVNQNNFTLNVSKLSADFTTEQMDKMTRYLCLHSQYVLDIDLDFFSTANPFLSLYEEIGLYDLLRVIFEFDRPTVRKPSVEELEECVQRREKQLDDLEKLFKHLEEHDNLDEYNEDNDYVDAVVNLVDIVNQEANRRGERPDWWAIHNAGLTADQGGLPHHISSLEEIQHIMKNAFIPFLKRIPKPVMITVARSSLDGYCPADQVDMIQKLVLDALADAFDVDDPYLYYLKANTDE